MSRRFVWEESHVVNSLGRFVVTIYQGESIKCDAAAGLKSGGPAAMTVYAIAQ
jgi:hypothetical protein